MGIPIKESYFAIDFLSIFAFQNFTE